MNVDSFEERFSLVLSPLNVFTWGGILVIALIVLTTALIAFTPLREWIPGYQDPHTRSRATYAAFQADSLAEELKRNELYLQSVQMILQGQNPDSVLRPDLPDNPKAINYDTIQADVSKEDSLLREQMENALKYDLVFGADAASAGSLSAFTFFSPMQGVVTSQFDLKKKHYGVDITAPKNEAVKCTLDGTVVLATWTSETGHVIQIQHSNNLLSVYKHNSVLLKEVGDQIRAGEPIAIIGESGELSTGPHLHFELWYKGRPVNPEDFMQF